MEEAYKMIAIGILAAWVLGLVVYLVAARNLTADDVGFTIFLGSSCAMVVAIAWPGVVIIGALTSLIMGARRLLHGKQPPIRDLRRVHHP